MKKNMTKKQQAQVNQIRKEWVNFIAKKGNGMISRKQIKEDLLSHLSDLDLLNSKNNEILITSDTEKVSEILTLYDCTNVHSWAGNWGEKDEGSVLFGNCCFGTHYQYQYFDNGTPEQPIEWVKDPQFNTKKTLVVLIHSHIWDHYDGAEEDNYGKKLLIFLPPI